MGRQAADKQQQGEGQRLGEDDRPGAAGGDEGGAMRIP